MARTACFSIALVYVLMSADLAAGERGLFRSRYVTPFQRAGHPERVAWYARATNTPQYRAGYVGGGAALFGQPRYLNEGTWGRDYVGPFGMRRVWLNWWHGRRAQGGSGAYQTDGPKFP